MCLLSKYFRLNVSLKIKYWHLNDCGWSWRTSWLITGLSITHDIFILMIVTLTEGRVAVLLCCTAYHSPSMGSLGRFQASNYVLLQSWEEEWWSQSLHGCACHILLHYYDRRRSIFQIYKSSLQLIRIFSSESIRSGI